MPRTKFVPGFLSALALVASLAACKHEEVVSTTAIRSVRMVQPIVPPTVPAAEELATAICRHEQVCINRRARPGSLPAPVEADAACVAQVRPSAVTSLDALDCSPAVARAGLKNCLAALATDDCTTTVSSEPLLIRGCRPAQICSAGLTAR
jgi:hypothetical protein